MIGYSEGMRIFQRERARRSVISINLRFGLGWIRTSVWVYFSEFAAYFRSTFLLDCFWVTAYAKNLPLLFYVMKDSPSCHNSLLYNNIESNLNIKIWTYFIKRFCTDYVNVNKSKSIISELCHNVCQSKQRIAKFNLLSHK